MVLDQVELESVEDIGGGLFNALFTDDVAECFRSSLTRARDGSFGLRIRLSFSDAPDLIDIPWEFLFDKNNGSYIGLSNQTPIIRKLDLGHIPKLREVHGCLRILVMISSPSDHRLLDVDREWERINQATKLLQEQGRIELTLVEPSLRSLQQALRSRKKHYHVFHYIGHGGFSKVDNDGVLILENAKKKSHLVSGQHLATILHDEPTLQLIFLNTCHGGRTSVRDPFAGVGQTLLQRGIPAIIAMQFEITDEAAITFSEDFYSAVVDGYSIETAVTEARKGIFADGNILEWATPVLYTSIEGGVLLSEHMQFISEPEPEPEKKAPVGQSKPKKAIGTEEPPDKPRSGIIFGGVIALAAVGFGGYQLLSGSNNDVGTSTASVPVTTPKPVAENVKQVATIAERPSTKLPENMPKMVLIPAGNFIMGCRDDKESDCQDDEKPDHKVNIKQFYLAETEVTVGQYLTCVEDGGCDEPEWRESGSEYNIKTGSNDHYKKMDAALTNESSPIVGVSWNDAQKYVQWLSKKTGDKYRLPSEAEWEYAARADTETSYSWGSSIGKGNANCHSCGDSFEFLSPVTSFASNKYGLFDMHGNVWEWVEDKWHSDYNSAPNDGSAWVSGSSSDRVLRGGSWSSYPRNLRSAIRINFGTPDYRGSFIGFRPAQSYGE